MILEGLKLMVIGMGIVYIFLILLMVLIPLTARILREDHTAGPGGVTTEGKKPGQDLIAVLTAAVSAFKSKKRN